LLSYQEILELRHREDFVFSSILPEYFEDFFPFLEKSYKLLKLFEIQLSAMVAVGLLHNVSGIGMQGLIRQTFLEDTCC
jgi:hypothetical protein